MREHTLSIISGAALADIERDLTLITDAATTAVRLEAAGRIRHTLDALLVDTISTARAEGLTWQQVGDLLGLTRQGAQQYYRRATR